MADAVTSQTIQDGPKQAVLKFTNLSDGTGESAVAKVDVSALASKDGKACAYVSILRVIFTTTGMSVRILEDATADVLVMELPTDQSGDVDMSHFGGIPNTKASGYTGDLVFTTVGHTAGDTYSVILVVDKHYG